MKKLGVIINPVAGIGGKLGFKGSDGLEVLEKAKELGSKSDSPKRAMQALNVISKIKDKIEVYTYPQKMGEYELRESGFDPIILGSMKKEDTNAEDTIQAAKDMVEAGVDLILFAGGDGTARNIYTAIGNQVVTLGIPAGVKIHSAVYAISPISAGRAAVLYLEDKVSETREAEVMDINEEQFRKGRVDAKLYGYLKVPKINSCVQNVKSGGYNDEMKLEGIADEIVDNMEEDILYIIGPGTTTRGIMDLLDLHNTLLGVDVVMNKKLISNDVNELELWDLVEKHKAKIIVTVIGGQGHIFGRGNQQISSRIIRKIGKENIIVVATKEKLNSIKSKFLIVDTGDLELDELLSGYIRVISGFEEWIVNKIESFTE